MRERLLAVNAATIDRRLASVWAVTAGQRRPAHWDQGPAEQRAVAHLRRLEGIRLPASWRGTLLQHCGGTLSGRFVWTWLSLRSGAYNDPPRSPTLDARSFVPLQRYSMALGTSRRRSQSNGWDGIERLVAHGDYRSAIARLGEQYTAYFVGVAFGVCGDMRAAADVVQDVFVQFQERQTLATYDPGRGARLKTWLYKIVVNKALERKRGVQVTESLDDHPSLLVSATSRDRARSPEVANADLKELFAYLQSCLPLLGSNERAALRLHVSGVPDARIASRLGVEEVTVRWYRYRWQKHLGGLKRAIDALPPYYRAMALRVATTLVRAERLKLSHTAAIAATLRRLVATIDSISPCRAVLCQWLAGHDAVAACRTTASTRVHLDSCLSTLRGLYPDLVALLEEDEPRRATADGPST